ncbi:hypothetical protein [Adhaeribacter terreus]|uniref:Uncharacterized protein n=1 Tax=Adhaeribacter terreus TaxID=529703 RepID=A0ABW0E9G0_9BACT
MKWISGLGGFIEGNKNLGNPKFVKSLIQIARKRKKPRLAAELLPDAQETKLRGRKLYTKVFTLF